MVEPISTAAATTVTAVSATSAASTAPAVSAATQAAVPAASTGIEGKMTIQEAAGKVSATTKDAEIIRHLAWAMLTHGEIQVVNQSEIVDEFAGPIYTGLAAATPAPSSPSAKNSSLKGDIVGPQGGEKVPSSLKDSVTVPPTQEPIPETLKNSDKTIIPEPQPHLDKPLLSKDQSAVIAPREEIPKTIQVPQSPFPDKGLPPILTRMTGEHPAIQKLLDDYYKAPTIKAQLATDASKIVVERSLIDHKVSVDDASGKRTAICWIEEKVVDRKYLEYGHLSDVISEIRHGNIPTIRQVFLAIVDLTDLATFKIFRPVLLKYKLEDARVQLRQLSADLERKTLQPQLPKKTSTTYNIGREVEHRSWYKTDHVTERTGHKEVVVEKQFDLVALNLKDVCTREMTRAEMDQIMTRRNDLVELMGDGDAINRIETTFSPEQIATINKSAMVWTSENVLTTTTEYTTDHLFHRYGIDLKGFAGEKITTSEKQISVSEQKQISEYLSASDNLNLEKVNTYDDAIKKFSAMQKTATISSDPQMVAQYIQPSEGTRFEEGWITYIPGGSIANLGLKSDLGVKLNGWDFFWAGVDVATIALAAVTWGKSATITVPAKAMIMAGTRAFAKGITKAVVKSGAKAGAKALARNGTKAVIKATVKQTGKVTLINVGKKAGAKATAKTVANVATKTGFLPNARYIKNGFTYLTDKQGRVVKAMGKLKNIPGVRSPENQRIAAQLGRAGDEGGHLIPANYGGPGSLINHVPQTRTVNRSVIKRIENEMGRALKAGKNVEYTIMPHYPTPTSLRPDKFTIRYTIDGVQKIRRISNV